MKQSRLLLWITLLLIALVAVLRYKHTRRAQPIPPPAPHHATADTRPPILPPVATADPMPPATPPPALAPAPARDPVAITDGMTIDFSSGRPVVTASDPAADPELAAALAEMQAATAGIVITSDEIAPTEEPAPSKPDPSP